LNYRDGLARSAVTAALRLRSRHGHAPEQPVCPIDLALAENVDVRFEAIKSLEGMYSPDGPVIVLGSLRPRGRRAYTCAHELGHHVFEHGLRVDELLDGDSDGGQKDEAEYVADRFAAALLMPKLAVLHAFAARRWEIETSTPEQVYTVASLLGVGYTTLIGYLQGTLRILSASAAGQLRKTTPKAVRSRILGTDPIAGLIIVDEFWCGRPVDAEVGDAIVAPDGVSIAGDAVERTGDRVFRAKAPGIASLRCGAWAVDVRVTRAAFTGLAMHRHLEEANDDA
jgi:hypothetical protein